VRNYTIPPICGVPIGVAAVSLNFTVTGPGQTAPGFLTAWPTGGTVPIPSILNWDHVPAQVANAAVVPTNGSGSITVNVSAPTHVIIDVNGYYAGAGAAAENTFLGLNAGNFTMTGDNNTGLGHNALFSNTTGFNNTATGHNALVSNDTGSHNTASGTGALLGNTGGMQNTATGSGALNINVAGIQNTATGAGALSTNMSGNDNTADGAGALQNATGSFNIGIGAGAGINLTTGSGDVCIANTGVAGESGTIRIGTAQTATFVAGITGTGVTGVPVLVSGTGQLGVASSSRLVKEEIREIAAESDGLMKLRPVAFRYKPQIDPTGLTQYGLIAEEVANVYPDLVAYDRDGRPETVRYQLINALLLNEVQKQHRSADAQEETIEQQKGTIDRQQAEIEELKARLSRLEARLFADPRP